MLTAYSYPGNVRQLEHIVQRAVAIAQSARSTAGRHARGTARRTGRRRPPEASVAAAREKAEREMIVAALARHHGEIGATARELQVSRTTMWRLMKKHGIES